MGNVVDAEASGLEAAAEDIAFVSEVWTFEVTTPDGNREKATGITANVARRGQDGGWRIAILNPLGTT